LTVATRMVKLLTMSKDMETSIDTRSERTRFRFPVS